MCGKSETKTTTKKKGNTSNELKLPSYVNEASKTAVNLATHAATSPVDPYTGQLVAGLSDREQNAMGALDAYQPVSQLPGALANINASQGAPTMERIVDESGRLGAIADYFNPYVQQTLNPTLSSIHDAWAQANKRLGSMAAGAGAFGDARHGILEAENTANAAGQVEDATYKAYYDAWNQAMGGRLSDINRFTGQENDYFRRLLEGAKTAMNASGMDQQQTLQLLRERLNAGAIERGVDQAGLTAAYGEWLRQQEEQQRRIMQLAQVNATTPYEKTQEGKYNETGSTVTQQPDNTGFALAGSVLGAALAPATGGASLALAGGLGSMPGGNANYLSAAYGGNGGWQTTTNPYSATAPWLS